MKFSCDLKLLSEAISNVSIAISPKSTIPALEGVLLQCIDGKLTLSGYDLEIGVTKKIPVHVEQEGTIVLDARILGDILRKMPGSEVLIESDDQFLTLIQGEGTEFHILGMSREEYPELPAVQDQNRFEMPEYLLKNMINQTLFAISQNDQTPVLTGCLFDLKDGMIRVVAVDGYRVAVRNEPLQFSQECSFIVPGKTLGEITKLLSDQQDRNAEVIICDKHIVFSVNGYRVISRLLQGDYLDYQSAIPQSQTTTIHVDTRLFTQSIERTSIIINDRNKSPIKMEVLETTLNLTCESPIGKASDFCAAQIEGEQLKIAFNNKFMIDALRHAECDELLILLNGPHSPIKIVPVEGDSFLFLVLPVRLKNDN